MKTGLFFGSFNPFHNGHLAIARNFLEHSDITHITFVVSPQNPLKKSSVLINEKHRLKMTQLAVRDENNMDVSDIEFNLPRPSFTINTLNLLQEKSPSSNWVLLMGNDSLNDLPRWKDYKTLLNRYEIYVYPRSGTISLIPVHDHIKVYNFPLVDISSTRVRKMIMTKASVEKIIPPAVSQYIKQNRLYLS